jgi:septal ring factor EnvC (AmiA/AmiB activator)
MAGVAALAVVLITVTVLNFRGQNSEMDFTRLQGALIREEMTKKAEIDRKMAAIEERKANWDPAFRADFERQLNRIEESIKQCRKNLEASPNDLNQVQRMLDLYEEKRQLLEDVERLKW